MKMYRACVNIYLDGEYLESIREEDGSLPDWVHEYQAAPRLYKHYTCNDLESAVMLALTDFFNQKEIFEDLDLDFWEYDLEGIDKAFDDECTYIFTRMFNGAPHDHIEVDIIEHVF